ncbi:MAG: hypothetical protein KDA51_11405, partial [Planctomycetales bacterium]|nr:hypothetical protein [Planctomycetales bacterium]
RDPRWVIDFIWKLFNECRNRGFYFVGHNALAFDSEMVANVIREFTGNEWQFQGDELVDTGCLEKITRCYSAYLSPTQWLEPKPNEKLCAFMTRASRSVKQGVKWNIEACVERYQLCEKFGLCENDLHGAEADSFVCHLMIEAHRKGEIIL